MLLVMVAAPLGGAGPLGAQVFYAPPFSAYDDPRYPGVYGGAPLPERAIVRGLRQDGFRPLGRPVLNRDVYVLDAIDPDGAHVRLIVGAFDGEIIQAFVNRRPPAVRVDPDDAPITDVMPRRQAQPPARTVAPPVARLPDIQTTQPRTDTPAVTPSRPTVVKRSPLALPKEPDAAGVPDRPVQGSKVAPRVIPIGPDVKAPATTVAPNIDMPAPAPPVSPPRAEVRQPALSGRDLPPLPPTPAAPDLGAASSQTPSAPPPAVLDFRSGKTETD